MINFIFSIMIPRTIKLFLLDVQRMKKKYSRQLLLHSDLCFQIIHHFYPLNKCNYSFKICKLPRFIATRFNYCWKFSVTATIYIMNVNHLMQGKYLLFQTNQHFKKINIENKSLKQKQISDKTVRSYRSKNIWKGDWWTQTTENF